MNQPRGAHWHFLCVECGFGDHELGHLLEADEIHCLVCLEESGREIRLHRWITVEVTAETSPARSEAA